MAKLWFGRGELLDLDVCVLLYAPRRRRLNLDTTSRIEIFAGLTHCAPPRFQPARISPSMPSNPDRA